MKINNLSELNGYGVGDTVTYKNHLREYQGSECMGEIVEILQVIHPEHGPHSEYFIIEDMGRIRSVHRSQIVCKSNKKQSVR